MCRRRAGVPSCWGVNREIAEGEFGRFTMNGDAWDPAYGERTSALGTVDVALRDRRDVAPLVYADSGSSYVTV